MNKEDYECKQMMLDVYSVLDDADNHFDTLRTGIVAPKLLLKNQLILITTTEKIAVSPITGDAVDKKNKFEKLCESVFKICSGASAYYSAAGTANPELKAKVRFTIARLKKIPYSKTEARMQGIIDVVTPIVGSLGDYGVVAADLTDANQKLKDFVDVMSKPQISIAKRKVQNANVHPYVQEGMRILKEMIDPIVNTMYSDYHDLYVLYYNAREILNFPHGTTVVEGYVFKIDGVTPIYNASVKFMPQNVSVNSKLDGSYRVVKFAIGVTTPEVTFGGVVKGFDPFEVKLGQRVKRNFMIEA
jgi:hypothetical protein